MKKQHFIAQSYKGQGIWAIQLFMTIRFSYCHKPLAAYHRSFFGVNGLVFSEVYVMDWSDDDEVSELWVFVMGFG